MSTSHNSGPWIDTWWPLLLILFGLIFALVLGNFSPVV
jgi:steroid 5-alpha reductase family enzyme